MPWEPLPDVAADPRPVAAGLDAVLRRLGGVPATTIATIVDSWEQIIGPDLAAVTSPLRVEKGCLTVSTLDSGYTTEIRFSEALIRQRVTELTGDRTIERVRVVVGRRPPRV